MTQHPQQEPAKRRLGLFGGSFDPVHLGHIHVARVAQGAFGLDRVVFVPAARPPHKPGRVLAPAADRLAMLELICACEPTWSASDLEFRRGGPSYTLDTVRELAALVGEPQASTIFMILGSDNLPGLPDWSRVEELMTCVEPIVVFREGVDEGALQQLEGRLSSVVLERLHAGFLKLPPVAASSTAVREQLTGEKAVLPELSPKVREYIREKGLYKRA